jgi:hypothetical protein
MPANRTWGVRQLDQPDTGRSAAATGVLTLGGAP